MDSSAEGLTTRHFACTRCGKCCNHAPELELGEAAAYADTFVLQLLMRIYSLPRSLADYESPLPRAEASAEYYESKRLLGQFAAASWNARVRRGSRLVEYIQYLSLSVLPLDSGTATCPALSGDSCSIYERRPLSCRSVPLHYSRPAATAHRDLDGFVATSGFRCATGAVAPLVIRDTVIVDPAMLAARADALGLAAHDAAWKGALVRAMKAEEYGLPSPRTVETHAASGALTASMQGAWQLAEAERRISAGEAAQHLAAQRRVIERELRRPGLPPATALRLYQIDREYAAALGR